MSVPREIWITAHAKGERRSIKLPIAAVLLQSFMFYGHRTQNSRYGRRCVVVHDVMYDVILTPSDRWV